MDDLAVAGVITASEPSWIASFTGVNSRQFDKLVTEKLRREGADVVRNGRPWSLPLEDRALLIARTYLFWTLSFVVFTPYARPAAHHRAITRKLSARQHFFPGRPGGDEGFFG